MSYCRYPWYIWRGGPKGEEYICFQGLREDGTTAPVDEATIVPLEAVGCFLDAWLRRWPAHMTAEGMLKRLAEGDIDPEPRAGEYWPSRG